MENFELFVKSFVLSWFIYTYGKFLYMFMILLHVLFTFPLWIYTIRIYILHVCLLIALFILSLLNILSLYLYLVINAIDQEGESQISSLIVDLEKSKVTVFTSRSTDMFNGRSDSTTVLIYPLTHTKDLFSNFLELWKIKFVPLFF